MNRSSFPSLPAIASILFLVPFLLSCELLSPDSSVTSGDQTELVRFENAEFVAANPEYLEAIQLAFWHEGGLTADPRTAWSFLKQRNAIRHKYSATFPEVERYFTQPFRAGQIFIAVDTTMIDQVADPESDFYADVDPDLLPDSVSVIRFSTGRPDHWVRLYFSILNNPEFVAQAYSGLPGVFVSEPNYLGTFGGNPFPVYPGVIDGDFYYVINKITFIPERTSIFRVRPGTSGQFHAELVASGAGGGESWDDRFLELLHKIYRQFFERYHGDSGNRESGKMDSMP